MTGQRSQSAAHPADILAELGDTELAAGWLPEPIDEELPKHTPATPTAAVAPVPPVLAPPVQTPALAETDAGGDTPDIFPAQDGVQPTVTAVGTAPRAPSVTPSVPASTAATGHQQLKRREFGRRTWIAAAAVVVIATAAVPLVLTALPSAPGTASPIHSGNPPSRTANPTSSSSPALSAGPTAVGVYSGSKYGFQTPTSIAVGGGHVWVANYTGNSVTELDAGTGAWIRTLSGSRYGFDEPLAIIDDGTHVWVANRLDNSLTELNASNGGLVRTLSSDTDAIDNPYGIGADGAQLWVVNAVGSVTELRPATAAWYEPCPAVATASIPRLPWLPTGRISG